MRIRGIQVQGLRELRDPQRISFGPGYNAVLAHDQETAQALADVLLGLLFPESELWRAERHASPHDESTRAGVSLRLGTQALRVVADLGKSRAALGCWEPDGKRYRAVSSRPSEIGDVLLGAGREEWPAFSALCCLPLALSSARRTLSEEARAQHEARWMDLRVARQRARVLEREARSIEVTLAKHAMLDPLLPELPAALAQYRSWSEERERELEKLGRERAQLLEERARAHAIASTVRPVIGLGLTLAIAGAIGGWLAYEALYAGVGIGLAATGVALHKRWRARRSTSRIDGQLGGLRVREGSVERRFEAETSEVRTLMQRFAVDSAEALENEAAAHAQRLARSKALGEELRAARATFSEDETEELTRLDELLRASETASGGVERNALVDRFAAVVDTGRIAPEALESRLRVVAPLYLRALTHGEVIGLSGDLPGFAVECKGEPGGTPVRALDPPLLGLVALAFELALAESLAAGVAGPLIVLPDAAPLRDEDARPFARALARLSALRQVIQFAPLHESYAEHAQTTLIVS